MTSASRGAPVFVYGALRSGTTLFRLMLNSHERVYNPGEVDFLFDFLGRKQSGDWRYDREALISSRIFQAHRLELPAGKEGLDLLENFVEQFRARAGTRVLTMNLHRHAVRMAELMPQARVIHLLRDPRDVARSSVGMGWAGLSYYGVDHWIGTERDWDRASIPQSQVLTLKFEDLMVDLEPRLGEVCAFLGVPFSPAMLDYHRNTTYGPPDPRLSEQWRRKASRHEIGLLESKCGDMIGNRGYASGGAPHHPGVVERAKLSLLNRVGRWRMGIHRFGLLLLIGAKLTRLVGLRRLHLRFQRHMNAKTTQTLK